MLLCYSATKGILHLIGQVISDLLLIKTGDVLLQRLNLLLQTLDIALQLEVLQVVVILLGDVHVALGGPGQHVHRLVQGVQHGLCRTAIFVSVIEFELNLPDGGCLATPNLPLERPLTDRSSLGVAKRPLHKH